MTERIQEISKTMGRRGFLRGAGALVGLTVAGVGCSALNPGAAKPEVSPTKTPPPTATPDNPATVVAGVRGTQTAEANIQATIEAGVRGTQTAIARATGTPTATATATATEAPKATATATPVPSVEIDKYKKDLESIGIKINLPREGWPMTPEQAAEALKSTDPTHAIKPEQVTPIIETQADGKKVWNGWIMGEPAFPMKDGISYDKSLHAHFNSAGKPEFDPLKIFKSFDELTVQERADFETRLVDVKVNKRGMAVFARKGGEVRPGDTEKNTQFFFGTPEAEVKGVEEITLIPVSSELCVSDPELSGATKSFRQAAIEFRDNKDAQDGKVAVKWFNPETKQFEQLDGRMIAKLAEQKVDVSILEKMPANTPLSPEDMVQRFGGKPGNWVFEPKTGEWFYEAFQRKEGVRYVEGVGPVDASGNVLFGAEQANRDTSKVFDFDHIDTSALVKDVKAPGSFQATMFIRQGTVGDPKTVNHSWYTWGKGDVKLTQPGVEQMTFMPHNPELCLPADMPNELAARAKTLAVEQPDKNVTALFWNGSQFVQVQK